MYTAQAIPPIAKAGKTIMMVSSEMENMGSWGLAAPAQCMSHMTLLLDQHQYRSSYEQGVFSLLSLTTSSLLMPTIAGRFAYIRTPL